MNEKFVKVEVFIDTTNPDQLSILDNLLHTIGGSEVKVPSEEEPKPASTRTRKPKPAEESKPAAEEAKPAAEEAKPAAEEAKPTAEAPAPAAEEAKPADDGAKTYTIEEVREKLKEKVNDHREAIKAKLTELGAPNVSSLDPAKYADFMDFLNGCE